MSAYLCRVVGERPERAARYHPSTLRRLTAHALAIHLPVILWAAQGCLIARGVFGTSVEVAVGSGAACGLVIYLLERLVLATPKGLVVGALRLLVGVVVALLGASAVDLLVFEREITQQLRAEGEARMTAAHASRQAGLDEAAAQARKEWLAAQAAASCEADGTCGSRLRSVGPVYRELARQAERLRADHDRLQELAGAARDEHQADLQAWRTSARPLQEAGLLARLQALHGYIDGNAMAWHAWLAMFVFVLALELTVLFVKFAFDDTIDDHLERVREQLALHQANAYLEAATSPLAGARRLLEQPLD